jgi:hypothetical protein
LAGRGQVSWLPGLDCRAFPGSRRLPSGFDAVPLPGHSGGTAPVFHRTSLDHRPYVAGESTPNPLASKERGGLSAAPLGTSGAEDSYFFFVHFDEVESVSVLIPPWYVTVSVVVQVPVEHLALR